MKLTGLEELDRLHMLVPHLREIRVTMEQFERWMDIASMAFVELGDWRNAPQPWVLVYKGDLQIRPINKGCAVPQKVDAPSI